ncbi:MAG: hypothetical protein H6945_18535 [Zoogloeaceae bacterium]|nr:hypothetical protein [Rhodocyclaceae bacterium]MCP5237735.1 hypothetical protein [Zoogloeaceae bacterium]
MAKGKIRSPHQEEGDWHGPQELPGESFVSGTRIVKILFPGTSRAICEWIAVTVSCALIAAAVVNYG